MKSIFIIFAAVILASCSGGSGGSGGPGPTGPGAANYQNGVSGSGSDLPVDLGSTPCSGCSTIGTWTLSWTETAGVITGRFNGPWGNLEVSGSNNGSHLLFKVLPPSAMGPQNIDEINISINNVQWASATTMIGMDFSAKSGGVTVASQVVYPTIDKKASAVVIDDTPGGLSNFADFRGTYVASLVTEVSNYSFPGVGVSPENPRNFNHGTWIAKKYCDFGGAAWIKITYNQYNIMTYTVGWGQGGTGRESQLATNLDAGGTPGNFEVTHDGGAPSTTVGQKDGYLISNGHSPLLMFTTKGSFTDLNGEKKLTLNIKLVYQYPENTYLTVHPEAFEQDACEYNLELEKE